MLSKAAQLHTYSNGSVLRKTTARDLIKIPIWNGNRLIDTEHKAQIAATLISIRSLDLQPFHIVTYPEYDECSRPELKSFIVDGQHRLSILSEAYFKDPRLENFEVLIIEKSCQTQSEVTAYFKLLNNTRAIQWKDDPNLIAAPYVNLFEFTFNQGKKDKMKLVRPGVTKRPYMSIDALRENIVKNLSKIVKETPEEFVSRAVEFNRTWLEGEKTTPTDDKSIQRAIGIEFMLPQDMKWHWLVK
jgi:hypothetical protein